jgi:hypothetical protein
VWVALKTTYDSLAIPISTIDPATHTMGNTTMRVRRRLGNIAMSKYINCGNTQGGPSADTYEIVLSVVTRAEAAEPGMSRLSNFGGGNGTALDDFGGVFALHIDRGDREADRRARDGATQPLNLKETEMPPGSPAALCFLRLSQNPLGGYLSTAKTTPGVVHLVGHVPATTFAARLPVTAAGNMNAVNTLPAIVLPPIAVRLRTLSAATPAGATASTMAGSVLDPAAFARNASAAGAALLHGDAVYDASDETRGDEGSADDPPVADAYTSSEGEAPKLTTRTAIFVVGSTKCQSGLRTSPFSVHEGCRRQ